MTSAKAKTSKKTTHWDDNSGKGRDIRMVHEISPEALAMGDIHNMLVAHIAELFDPHAKIQDKVTAAVRDGAARGAFSSSEERVLLAVVSAVNVDKKDLGLEKLRRLRQQLIEDRAGDLAVAAAGVAVGSVEFGLTTLDDNAPVAKRRRRLWIALADFAGAVIGGVVGGVGGAGLGAGLASGIADGALPQD